MQGSSPNQVEGVDLAGSDPNPTVDASVTHYSERQQSVDELPLATTEEPSLAHGVVREERETTRFSLTLRVKHALFSTHYSEHARHPSWAGAFCLIAVIGAMVALLINGFVVGPEASLETRVIVAASFFGAVLVAGVGLLALRFLVPQRRKPQ